MRWTAIPRSSRTPTFVVEAVATRPIRLVTAASAEQTAALVQDAPVADYLNVVQRNAEQLLKLVEDLTEHFVLSF